MELYALAIVSGYLNTDSLSAIMDTKFFIPLCTPILLLLNITESDRKSQT